MHDFIPADSGYDECDGCGLLAEPEVVVAITVTCAWHPCQAPANHGSPCVVVVGDADEAVCSYCERVCGSATGDDAPDVDDEGDLFDLDDDLEPGPLY